MIPPGFSETERRWLAAQLLGLADCRYTPESASTNSELKQQLADGQLSGPTLLYTDAQPQGRGTKGRSWVMQPGLDVAYTIAVAPPPQLLAEPRLSLAVGALAALGVEEATGAPVKVTWPNDILCGSPLARKCGGILLETTSAPGGQRWLFAGIGLNVNSCSSGFPPALAGQVATLREAAGVECDRAAIILATARLLLGLLTAHSWSASNFATAITKLMEAWSARNMTHRKRYLLRREGVEVELQDAAVSLADGSLHCRDAAGKYYSFTNYTDLDPLP